MRRPDYNSLNYANDIVLCRLEDPSKFTALSVYPPLAIAPPRQGSDDTKWGQILPFGRGIAGNAIGRANSTLYGTLPNCASFDTRVPSTVSSLTLATASGSASLSRVSTTAPTPSDLATVSYVAVRTFTYPSAPTTSSTYQLSATSLPALTVTKGTTVCVTVTATAPLATGPSASNCAVAN